MFRISISVVPPDDGGGALMISYPRYDPAHRFALFHFVLRQIVGRDQASAFLHGGRQFARHGPMIKVVRIGGDPFQSARQIRLLEHLASFVIIPIAQKNAPRLGKLRQSFVFLQFSARPGQPAQTLPLPA